MYSVDFNRDIKKIRKEINKNYAQESSLDDRRSVKLDKDISSMGGKIETRDQFTRDRDRILFSSSFRRLEHKAQVYSHEKGDHYRTRLTHTLEVMQIARGIARNLGLNEDLTEAIALGHDIGHTPFGHAGEEILDEIMRGEYNLGGKLKHPINFGGFKHNFHSLKILDVLDRKHPNEKGLNLTWQVLEGILKHTKIKKDGKTWDLSRFVNNEHFFKLLVPNDCISKSYCPTFSDKSELNLDLKNSLTLEGQVVNIADEIAQRQHDLDDGLRDVELKIKESDVLDHFSIVIEKIINEVIKEILENKLLITGDDLTLLINLKENISDKSKIEEDHLKWKNIISDIISYFIHDVTKTTMKNIMKKRESLIKEKEILIEARNNLIDEKKAFIEEKEVLIWEKGDLIEIKSIIEDKKPFIDEKKAFVEEKEVLIRARETSISVNWNKKKYVMSQVVEFSNVAEKFNKKIEQYIENRIINSYNVNRFDGKAKFIIKQLFKAYYENPKQMNKKHLNNLSDLINDNLDKYYELKLKDGTKIRDIKFDSKDPEFILNFKDMDKLIKLLRLEVKLEDLDNPDIKLDLDFLKEIKDDTGKIEEKMECNDEEEQELIIFDAILQKINCMEKSEIMEEKNKGKQDKILFIKCLIENHYAYLSVICDHIAGMTDNYAKSEYKKLYLV